MIKIGGTSETRAPVRTKKAAGSKASFSAGASGEAKAAPGTSAAAPATMMSALIALQSDGGGNAQTLAAAQRTLDLLDRLQMQILDGKANASELEALAKAAAARAHASADKALLNVYDEIALRARVELAKLERS